MDLNLAYLFNAKTFLCGVPLAGRGPVQAIIKNQHNDKAGYVNNWVSLWGHRHYWASKIVTVSLEIKADQIEIKIGGAQAPNWKGTRIESEIDGIAWASAAAETVNGGKDWEGKVGEWGIEGPEPLVIVEKAGDAKGVWKTARIAHQNIARARSS